MGCKHSQLLALLMRIREDLPVKECRDIVDLYIDRIKHLTMAEIERELFT